MPTQEYEKAERLYDAGKFVDAVALATRAVELENSTPIQNHEALAAAVGLKGRILAAMGQYTEAEPLLVSAVKALENSKSDCWSKYASSLYDLGKLYIARGQYEQSDSIIKRALEIRQAHCDKRDPALINTIAALAGLRAYMGQLDEAETLFKQAIEACESGLSVEREQRAALISGLANVYMEKIQYQMAESLYRRALEMQSVQNGNLLERAKTLSNLGTLLQYQKRFAEGEQSFREALAIREPLLAEHPSVAATLNNLAQLLRLKGQLAESAALHEQALSIRIKTLGPEHPDVATSYNNIGRIRQDQGLYSDAENLYSKSLSIRLKVLGERHENSALSLHNLANLYLAIGDIESALKLGRKATSVVINLLGQSDRNVRSGGRSVQSRTLYFHSHLCALKRAEIGGYMPAEAALEESFTIAQWASRSRAAAAINQLSTRFGLGSSGLADHVRRHQDLADALRALDSRLIAAISVPESRRDPSIEQGMRSKIRRYEEQLEEVTSDLRRSFPTYVSLANPDPVSVSDVQLILGSNEALILFCDEHESGHMNEETFAWAICRNQARWYQIDFGTRAWTDRVAAIRCGIDEEEWATQARAAQCRELLALPDWIDASRPLPFHLGIAYELFQKLVEPFEEIIEGKQLIIVPSGPLSSLPFHVLVTSKPTCVVPTTFEGYRNVAWLGRLHAITVLPAVASLKALRGIIAKAESAPDDYIGYGNPVLQGNDTTCPAEARRINRDHIGRATIRGTGRRRSANIDELFSKGTTREAIIEQVRALCPLPETAVEIECVAQHFRKEATIIRLGSLATEGDIKALSANGTLARFRILHFATHALLAGDVELMAKRQGEPAIVLTPPEVPQDADDDGLLMASEVAQLKLNADWVVLSACNTAAGDALGADALSGLARAFLYAQARALLVSHWPVYSDAAVHLITRTFAQLDRDRGVGRADALQRAMIELMDDVSQPENAHPAVWGPFIVVGEGGR